MDRWSKFTEGYESQKFNALWSHLKTFAWSSARI